MSTPSASGQIYDYLLKCEPGAQFTAVMIQEALGVSDGAVSGFLFKLAKTGAIKLVGIEASKRVYEIVDLSGVKIRRTASIGSLPGRSVEGTSGASRVAGILRGLADQVEGFHSDLSTYSTAELLRELTRRETKSKGVK